MDDREFFLKHRKAEKDAFLNVIRALPTDKLDYKPHERSPSAREILATLVFEHAACCDLVAKGKAEWNPPPISSSEEAARTFETHWDDLSAKVAALDAAGWMKTAEFYMGGKKMSETPVGPFLWFCLFDAIHHRGQLSAYIRPMGGKVPAIYGPSGDSKA
jgi:uncharacterized damage-inducible protein DinB